MATPPTSGPSAKTTWEQRSQNETFAPTPVAVSAGDLIVAYVTTEDANYSATVADSQGNVYTLEQDVNVAQFARAQIWTAEASAGGSLTVTFTRDSTVADKWCGGAVRIWTSHGGIGASSKTNVSSGAPTLNLTTTFANSAIHVVNGDWAAVDGASRTWRTGAGALTEVSYERDAALGSSYSGYHADSSAVGVKAVGLSAPGAQKYSIVALEVRSPDYVPPAIELVAESTTPTGTGSGTVGLGSPLNMIYPAGIQAGDLILVMCGLKPDTSTFTTPATYTAPTNGTQNGGGGTTGADTGPTKVATFYKVAAGTESGTLAVTLGSSPNSAWGKILVFRKTDPDATWDIAAHNGIDSTTGSPFTAAMGGNPGLDVDDMAVVVGVIPTDATTFSGPTLTATGLTVSVTENSEPKTTQGNDTGGVIVTGLVTGGPATAAPTFSAVAAGTTTNTRGPIVLVRLRAVSAAAPASPRRPIFTSNPAVIRGTTW